MRKKLTHGPNLMYYLDKAFIHLSDLYQQFTYANDSWNNIPYTFFVISACFISMLRHSYFKHIIVNLLEVISIYFPGSAITVRASKKSKCTTFYPTEPSFSPRIVFTVHSSKFPLLTHFIGWVSTICFPNLAKESKLFAIFFFFTDN